MAAASSGLARPLSSSACLGGATPAWCAHLHTFCARLTYQQERLGNNADAVISYLHAEGHEVEFVPLTKLRPEGPPLTTGGLLQNIVSFGSVEIWMNGQWLRGLASPPDGKVYLDRGGLGLFRPFIGGATESGHCRPSSVYQHITDLWNWEQPFVKEPLGAMVLHSHFSIREQPFLPGALWTSGVAA